MDDLIYLVPLVLITLLPLLISCCKKELVLDPDLTTAIECARPMSPGEAARAQARERARERSRERAQARDRARERALSDSRLTTHDSDSRAPIKYESPTPTARARLPASDREPHEQSAKGFDDGKKKYYLNALERIEFERPNHEKRITERMMKKDDEGDHVDIQKACSKWNERIKMMKSGNERLTPAEYERVKFMASIGGPSPISADAMDRRMRGCPVNACRNRHRIEMAKKGEAENNIKTAILNVQPPPAAAAADAAVPAAATAADSHHTALEQQQQQPSKEFHTAEDSRPYSNLPGNVTKESK